MSRTQKMGKLQKSRRVWRAIVRNWKTKYRLVFSNESTLEQRLVIRHITIQKVFVVSVLTAFVLILLTAVIIALTPLRVYVPGYTTRREYKQYRQAALKIDSLEALVQHNQEYIDHYLAMVREEVPTTDETDGDAASTPQVHHTERDPAREEQSRRILEEAEHILGRTRKNNPAPTPGIDLAKVSNLSIRPPAFGAVVRTFSPEENHYGIDIQGGRNTAVCCAADGVVIFTGYNARDGHFIVVQHPGNLTSLYKHNRKVLKHVGERVSSGSPIALMGEPAPADEKKPRLHFELWYNGFPVNPLDYLVIQ